MKLVKYLSLVALFITTGMTFAQEAETEERKPGHYNNNRFKQLYEEFATPNMYRSPNGAPGPAYYQQQADYDMNLILDDKAARLYGTETITYTNNSPDELEYLWVQLDQNVRARDSKSPLIEGSGAFPAEMAGSFVNKYMGANYRDEQKQQQRNENTSNGYSISGLVTFLISCTDADIVYYAISVQR